MGDARLHDVSTQVAVRRFARIRFGTWWTADARRDHAMQQPVSNGEAHPSMSLVWKRYGQWKAHLYEDDRQVCKTGHGRFTVGASGGKRALLVDAVCDAHGRPYNGMCARCLKMYESLPRAARTLARMLAARAEPTLTVEQIRSALERGASERAVAEHGDPAPLSVCQKAARSRIVRA